MRLAYNDEFIFHRSLGAVLNDIPFAICLTGSICMNVRAVLCTVSDAAVNNVMKTIALTFCFDCNNVMIKRVIDAIQR